MKPSLKFFSAPSFAILAIGIGLAFFGGLSMGRQTPAGETTKSRESRSRQAENGRPTGGDTDLPQGRRGKGDPASVKESKDFAQAVRAVFRENVKLRRVEKFEKLVERTGIEHLPELVSLIRENDLCGNDSGEEWTRLWVSWGDRDPQAAIKFLKTYDWTGWDPAAQDEARNRTLASWAQTDPETARQFVESDPAFANGDRTLAFGFIEGWANVAPQAAADWLFKTGIGNRDDYGKIVDSLNRNGGQEAVDAWFSKLDPAQVPAKDRTGFAQAIARTKMEYEPDKAAAWVESHLGEPWVEESQIVGTTARAFARRDPQAAVEWANRTGLDLAANIAVTTWCEQDSGAAGQWVKENADIGHYESAATVMSYLLQKDPTAARKWVESISDKELRERLLAD